MATSMISQTLGGIGLFLVGMVLVTDGLRAAAGDSLRRVLLRFTGGPARAVVSGAAVTALVQSSSATTVATIGFVGAGLLTFEQGLGLVLGANVGTTATGWIVALFGLKFSVTVVALPMVGVGALTRLFLRGRGSHLGLALAGFGILFLGLEVLQGGMEGLSDTLTPAQFPDDTLVGRLLLLALGVGLTVVMQSSSAAVATALTAMHAGSLSLEQAAAMVIGINVGTTVTAGIAVIGASTAAKRTAFAHLLFNVLTGVVAFALLPAFVAISRALGARIAPGDTTILLAAFHTAFNLLGVVLVLPFLRPFAALVVRVIAQRGPVLTRFLDPRAAAQGSLATEAVRQTTIEIARAAFEATEAGLAQGHVTARETETLEAASAALREAEDYVGSLRFASPLSEQGQERHVSTIHALDHLGRFIDVALSPVEIDRAGPVELRKLRDRFREALIAAGHWSRDPKQPTPVETLRHLHEQASSSRRQLRADLLARTATGAISPTVAGKRLEALRWLEDASFHLWRLLERLRGERIMDVPAEDPPAPASGVGGAIPGEAVPDRAGAGEATDPAPPSGPSGPSGPSETAETAETAERAETVEPPEASVSPDPPSRPRE